MTRPTRVKIDSHPLLHNLKQVQQSARDSKIIAMVKANAYGCGINHILPALEGRVAAFGFASLEEAMAAKRLGINTPCILFQGFFTDDELATIEKNDIQCVIHQWTQLEILVRTPLPRQIKIWVKVDTGMHRLGFSPNELKKVFEALNACSWITQPIGLMSHFACADEPTKPDNLKQIKLFSKVSKDYSSTLLSMANSAAIFALPESHFDFVRPGIMLYGISPFPQQTGKMLGLRPVVHFHSAITAIHHFPPFSPVGYGAAWQSALPSKIGVIPVGYGDGYPRHIKENTPVWIQNTTVPIVGRISMDMMTVDLTALQQVQVGDPVELWGDNLPIEKIADSAETIGYELICKLTDRVRPS